MMFLIAFLRFMKLVCCKLCILNRISMFRVSREKSDKEIMREIQAIMRQIASSITYLPCLDETCKSLEIYQTRIHDQDNMYVMSLSKYVCV